MLLGLFYASFDFVRVTQLYTAPEDRVWPFASNTVAQASRTPLYQNAVRFAGISTIPLTEQNAAEQLAQAQRLMHFSPEARVVERIIKALQLLGREAEAQQAIAPHRISARVCGLGARAALAVFTRVCGAPITIVR